VDAELADELAGVIRIPVKVHGLAAARVLRGIARAEADAVPHLPGVPVAVMDAVDTERVILAVWAARPVRHTRTVVGDRSGEQLVKEPVALVSTSQ
jgi:hypothetical protein